MLRFIQLFVSGVGFLASAIQVLGFFGILPERLENFQIYKDHNSGPNPWTAVLIIAFMLWISFAFWASAMIQIVDKKYSMNKLMSTSPAMAKLSLTFPVWIVCLMIWFFTATEILSKTGQIVALEEFLGLVALTLCIGLPLGLYSVNFIHLLVKMFE